MSEFIGETPRPHRADVEKRARRDRVFLNNPVIMQGLGLAPLIVAESPLKLAYTFILPSDCTFDVLAGIEILPL